MRGYGISTRFNISEGKTFCVHRWKESNFPTGATLYQEGLCSTELNLTKGSTITGYRPLTKPGGMRPGHVLPGKKCFTQRNPDLRRKPRLPGKRNPAGCGPLGPGLDTPDSRRMKWHYFSAVTVTWPKGCELITLTRRLSTAESLSGIA